MFKENFDDEIDWAVDDQSPKVNSHIGGYSQPNTKPVTGGMPKATDNIKQSSNRPPGLNPALDAGKKSEGTGRSGALPK